MKKLILLTALSCQISLAVQTVKKGDLVPHDGVLFTQEEEYKLRIISQERDYLEKKSEILQNQNELLDSKVKLWLDQSESLSKSLIEQQNESFWKNAGFFGLGVLATVGVVFAVKGAVK